MDVIDARAKLLTNAEVAAMIKDARKQSKGGHNAARTKHLENMSTVLYQADHYLQDTPCASQTQEHLKAFASATKSLNLTKGEFIQICNLRPTTPVEVQLVVEECEERLSEEQVDNLIELVLEHLPERSESKAVPKTVVI